MCSFRGVKSDVYTAGLNKLLAHKRKRRDNGKAANRVNMKGRPFKIETVLRVIPGCTCVWSPSLQQWEHFCSHCKAIRSVYLYDRGLTRVHLFKKKQIDCLIPSRKGGNQITFSAVSGAKDRAIAAERINVERNNRELRHYAGFDCQTTLTGVFLAHHEGQVARGLTNLKQSLQDWTQRSASGLFTD